MSIELRLCPFCGGSAILQEHPAHTHAIAQFMPDHTGSATVECSGCNVGMIDDTVALVVAAWNRRPALAASQQEPTAWKVHTVAKGAHQWVHEKGPALFQKLVLAEGWMNERIDFDGYRNAWIEPLYTASPPPAARAWSVVLAVPVCWRCGLSHVTNPHPEAGKPSFLLEVGCPTECLPCLVKSRHEWSLRASRAEKLVRDYQVSGRPVQPSGEKDL